MATGNPNDVRRNPDPMMDSAWGCGWAWLWFWLFIIVILFGGWGWGGWYRGWEGPWGWWGPRQAPPPAAQAPQAPRAPEEHATSGEFLGKTVTVRGQVHQVLSPQAFTLAGTEGGHELLVIDKNAKDHVKKGEKVEVTGKVEKFEQAELHKQTSVDLNKVPSNEFTGRPAVVASRVATEASTARGGG